MLMEDFWDELKDSKRYVRQGDMMKDYCKEYSDTAYTMATSRLENAKKVKLMIDKMVMPTMHAMTTTETTDCMQQCKAHYVKETNRLNKYVTEVATMIAMAKM